MEYHLREVTQLSEHFEGLMQKDCPQFSSSGEWTAYLDTEVERVVTLVAHLEQAWIEAKSTGDDEVRRAAKAPRKRVDQARALLDKLQGCAEDNGAPISQASCGDASSARCHGARRRSPCRSRRRRPRLGYRPRHGQEPRSRSKARPRSSPAAAPASASPSRSSSRAPAPTSPSAAASWSTWSRSAKAIHDLGKRTFAVAVDVRQEDQVKAHGRARGRTSGDGSTSWSTTPAPRSGPSRRTSRSTAGTRWCGSTSPAPSSAASGPGAR